MTLLELKNALHAHPGQPPRFILPHGASVPAHFHLTEVGHVVKTFVDCGGTIRKREACVLQLWVNDCDADHRLKAGRFAEILDLGAKVLRHDDFSVEVEYGDEVISQFPIGAVRHTEDAVEFTLTAKQTDCLAREKCGIGDEACCAPAEEALAGQCC